MTLALEVKIDRVSVAARSGNDGRNCWGLRIDYLKS